MFLKYVDIAQQISTPPCPFRSHGLQRLKCSYYVSCISLIYMVLNRAIGTLRGAGRCFQGKFSDNYWYEKTF